MHSQRPPSWLVPAALALGLALSFSSVFADDIQIEEGPEPTATTAPPAPVPKLKSAPVQPTPTPVSSAQATPSGEDEDIVETDEGTVTPTPVPTKAPKAKQAKAKATPTPTEEEDNGYIEEDKIAKGDNLPQKFGELDKPLVIFTLDALYNRAFDTNNGNSEFSNGYGGDFRAEVQFYRVLSLGLYYDFTAFSVPHTTVLTGPLGMFGRIIPVKQGPLELYAIGGMGLNSLANANPPAYLANFHGFAGGGLRLSFTDNWGLDGNVVYNYYSPQTHPLNTVAIRGGLTYMVDLQSFLASLTAPPKPKVMKGEANEPE